MLLGEMNQCAQAYLNVFFQEFLSILINKDLVIITGNFIHFQVNCVFVIVTVLITLIIFAAATALVAVLASLFVLVIRSTSS